MPPRLAEKIEKAAHRLGISKRELLASLVSKHLDIEGDQLVVHPSQASRSGNAADEVLTPAEAAALLRIPETEIIVAAQAGDLPARQIAGEWRFARSALLRWLGG
jgi:excisionase family DNA binding protein